MPNVKIYIDETLLATRKAGILDALEPLRRLLCDELNVAPSACHVVIQSVIGMADQPLVSMEFQYLSKPDRTPERIRNACIVFRDFLIGPLGCSPAIRATPLDPATYVALK